MCSILLPNWVQAKTVVPKVDRRARVQRLEQLETARRTANPRPTYGSTIVARTRRWTRTPQGDPLRRATPVAARRRPDRGRSRRPPVPLRYRHRASPRPHRRPDASGTVTPARRARRLPAAPARAGRSRPASVRWDCLVHTPAVPTRGRAILRPRHGGVSVNV